MSIKGVFEEPHAGFDRGAIDSLIAAHGPLPAGYVEFLETIDGGCTEPQMLVYGFKGRPVTVGLREVYGAARAEERTTFKRSLGELPPGVVRIASDFSDHNCLFMIADGSADAGAIYAETEDTNETVAETLDEFVYHSARVADSIQQLLSECLLTQEQVPAAVVEATPYVAPEPFPDPADARRAVASGHPDISNPGSVYFYDTRNHFNYTVFKDVRANDGKPAAPTWQPPQVELFDDSENAELDLLSAGFVILRPEAVEELGDLFAPFGELLEVTTADGPLWAFRCLNRVAGTLVDPTQALNKAGGHTNPFELVFDASKCVDAGISTLAEQNNDAKWQYIFFTKPVVDQIQAAIRATAFEPGLSGEWCNGSGRLRVRGWV